MSSNSSPAQDAAPQPKVNPWLIGIVVSLAAFMVAIRRWVPPELAPDWYSF